MMSRQARHARRTTLLLAALAAAACSGDRATAPPGGTSFDAVRARADVGAVQGALGAPVLQSFAALGERFGVVPAAATAAGAGRELLSAAAGSPSAADARQMAARLSADVLAASGTAVLPSWLLGTTFVYDAAQGRYVAAPGRAGAPANGVRFILYAVNPLTHQPVTSAEIGYADLTDVGATRPSGIALRLAVVSAGTTYLDYSLAADGSDDGSGTLSVAGFATDGATRLNFEIDAAGRATPTGGTLDVTFEFTVPARGFSATGRVTGTSAAFGAASSGTVDLTVNTGDAVITYAVVGDGRTMNATVTVNGKPFATIAGDAQHVEVRGAGGRALTAQEAEALRQLLGLADGIFQLFGQLLAPVAGLVGLAALPR